MPPNPLNGSIQILSSPLSLGYYSTRARSWLSGFSPLHRIFPQFRIISILGIPFIFIQEP